MVIMMMFHTVISNDINVTCYSSLQRQVDLLDGSPSLMINSLWVGRQTDREGNQANQALSSFILSRKLNHDDLQLPAAAVQGADTISVLADIVEHVPAIIIVHPYTNKSSYLENSTSCATHNDGPVASKIRRAAPDGGHAVPRRREHRQRFGRSSSERVPQ